MGSSGLEVSPLMGLGLWENQLGAINPSDTFSAPTPALKSQAHVAPVAAPNTRPWGQGPALASPLAWSRAWWTEGRQGRPDMAEEPFPTSHCSHWHRAQRWWPFLGSGTKLLCPGLATQ